MRLTKTCKLSIFSTVKLSSALLFFSPKGQLDHFFHFSHENIEVLKKKSLMSHES